MPAKQVPSEEDSRPPKVMSLRLPQPLASELAVVARTDGVSISEAIRHAVGDYITARRASADFQSELKRRMEEDKEAFERLRQGKP